jgi:arylsulfatase A
MNLVFPQFTPKPLRVGSSAPARSIPIVLLFAFLVATPTNANEEETPNVIFIMADDMGYGDPKCNNPNSKIPTPAFDRLAAEGMSFTDAHTGSAVCTPTRYGVVTGRYCWRSRLKRGVLDGYGSHLIEDGRETVANMLKEAGYNTAVIGKWHLGLDFAPIADDADRSKMKAGGVNWRFDYTKPLTHGPHVLGFEHSYIIPASLDFPPYIYIEDGRVVDLPTVEQPAVRFPRFLRRGERAPLLDMEDCLDDLTTKAVEHLEERSKIDKPFFLYFPLTAPHKPAWPDERFVGKSGRGPYGDFVIQVDATVGRVLDALDQYELADNTLIFYTSDNGSYMFRLDEDQPDHVDDATIQGYRPEHHTANHVLRGTKADVWEAGHRVPFFVRWPGKIEPGTTCDETICLVDLFATCAELVGKDLKGDVAEDSFSLVAALRQNGDFERAPVVHHSASGMFAIRDGDWKLVAGNGSGGRQSPKGKPFAKPYMLFNMKTDLSETKDVAADNPAIVRRLSDQLQSMIDAGRTADR